MQHSNLNVFLLIKYMCLFLLGRYMYIEASYPRQPGQAARLFSPLVTVSGSSTKCLEFWYHMYGPHVGSLSVYTNTTAGILSTAIWSKNATQGNLWKSAVVEVQMNQSYMVRFEIAIYALLSCWGLIDRGKAPGICTQWCSQILSLTKNDTSPLKRKPLPLPLGQQMVQMRPQVTKCQTDSISLSGAKN